VGNCTLALSADSCAASSVPLLYYVLYVRTDMRSMDWIWMHPCIDWIGLDQKFFATIYNVSLYD